jgi:NarL family two-component system response regulator LiaR
MVADRHPDVVLMDIAMPRLNGIEATRRIKAMSPSTAVLVLTAYDDDIYIVTLLEAGAAGYLLKDVHADELVRAVRAVHAGEPVLSPVVMRKMLSHFAVSQHAPIRLADPDSLTAQERSILLLAARGLSNKAIAKEMSLSPRTVQAHLAHIFTKLRVASRTEAVVMSIKEGWLRPEDID